MTRLIQWARDKTAPDDDILKWIPMKKKFFIFIRISLKFVSGDLVDNKPEIQIIGLAPYRQSVIWSNDGLVYWGMYVSLVAPFTNMVQL